MTAGSGKLKKSVKEISIKALRSTNCEAVLVCSKFSSRICFYSEKGYDYQQFEQPDFLAAISHKVKNEVYSDFEKDPLFSKLDWVKTYPTLKSVIAYPIINTKKANIGCIIIFTANLVSKKELPKISKQLNDLSEILSVNDELSSLSYYENIFNISSEMICVIGMDGFFKKINPTFRRALLWSEADLMKSKIMDFIHPDDAVTLDKKIRAINGRTKNIAFPIRFRDKNGGYRKIEWVLSVDISNKLLYGMGRDVTMFEETQHELVLAKEMLEDTNRVAKIGGWQFDVLTQDLYWTSITREIHEVEQDFPVTLDAGISFYKPGANQEKISKLFNLAIKKGRPYDVELEIITKKGNPKWVRAIGNPKFEKGVCVKVTGSLQDIDKDRQNKEALEEINSRMQAILDASTETSIIATDINGRITHFNSGSEYLLGYAAKELIGIYTPIIFYDKQELEKQAKELSEEFACEVKPGIDSFRYKSKLGLADNGEFTYIRRDQEKINVKISVTPIKDRNEIIVGYLSVAVDITEKKLWEQKILESEKKYRIFFDSSQVVMYTHDMAGNFISINSIGAQLLGYNRDELINKNILDIIPIKSKVSFPYYLKELKENGKSKGLMQIIDNNQKEVTWMFNNVVTESAEGERYVLGNVMDITDRIELEKDLNEAKQIAEANAKMKDIFLANMSHEIRTPMNAITGFGNLLSHTPLDEEQEEYLKSINIASSNLLNIINDILDFSKIESGQISLENIEFNLKDQVANVSKLFKANSSAKNLNFESQLDLNMPEYILGDPTRLSQVLTNLIANAIKFTEDGFVKLEVKVEKEVEEMVEIKFLVTDSGIGISKDKIGVIFDRFTQANTNTTRKYGGTGLGLSISKSLVELQKGVFHVESEEGVGSTFGFTMPFKKVARPKQMPTEMVISKYPKSDVRVLLVEDNLLNQKLAMKVLEKQGFEAKMAENGKIATEILQKEGFDVILMDLQMPEMDGYTATQYIRDTLQLDIPIIAMTAHSLVGEKEKCLEIGMNDYLPKPFNQDRLYEKILELTKNRKMEKTKSSIDLNYLRSIAEGNKEFEKEILSSSLTAIPSDLDMLIKAIRLLELKDISSIAHKLKSSFYVIGINDESILSELEHNGIDDLSTLEEMYFRLENIYQESRESLEYELVENYS